MEECLQVGQFEAEMSSDSFQLLGMAERGFLPAALARRSRHDTPTLAIALSSLGICFLTNFKFKQVFGPPPVPPSNVRKSSRRFTGCSS